MVWGGHYATGGALLSEPAAPIGRGKTLDVRVSIQTPLFTQYKTTVFLENRNPVPLVLEYNLPKRPAFDIKIRWSCDRGILERTEATLRNRFFPPPRSAVSTVEAELALYPQQSGERTKIPVLRETAKLRIISPSPSILLRNGVLDGFRIGRYLNPADPKVQKEFDLSHSWAMIYPEKFLPPRFFYLVDEESRDLPISAHLHLGDFALDYPWFSLGKRQYIALDYGLVRKIEDLIEELDKAGLPGEKIRFIYGFRPPSYNIGRIESDGRKSLKAPFSFHQYGKAVDFILDADNDLRLDDLDGDGRITVRDAGVLVHYVNVLDRKYRDRAVPLYGGAGIYDHHDFWERPVQTPYVHMDVRGFLDEEGRLIRWPKNWPDTGEPIDWENL